MYIYSIYWDKKKRRDPQSKQKHLMSIVKVSKKQKKYYYLYLIKIVNSYKKDGSFRNVENLSDFTFVTFFSKTSKKRKNYIPSLKNKRSLL